MLGMIALGVTCGTLGQPLAAPGEAVRYDGHKVVSVLVDDPKLRRAVIGLSEGLWGCGEPGPGFPLRLQVSPHALTALDDLDVPYVVEIDNLQALIDAENARLAGAALERPFEDGAVRGELPGTFFDDFRNNDQISDYMNALVAAYPDRVSRQAIGQSVEGREIYAMRMTRPGKGPKPVIFMNALQHAREWIAGSTGAYIVDRLVRNPDADPRVESLLADFEVIMVPVLNPDGYAYSWSQSRLWRTNRNLAHGCAGVDTNRNWGSFWQPSGCGETYGGPESFSELETRAVRDFVAGMPNVVVYVDLHSYGRDLLSPYGHQFDPPPDAASVFDAFNNGVIQAIGDVNNEQWFGGPSPNHVGYFVYGGAKDWFFDGRGVLGWTWELDTSFILPPSRIPMTGSEVFGGVLALGPLVREHAVRVRFVGEGRPMRVSTTSATPVRFSVTRGTGPVDPAATKLWCRVGRTGPFAELPLSDADDGTLSAELPAVPCGGVVQYYVEARSLAGAPHTSPPGGAVEPYEAAASEADVIVRFDLDTRQGWSGNDFWLCVEPHGNAAMPEEPAQGTGCLVAARRHGPGLPINTTNVSRDVPSPVTSPAIDASGRSSVRLAYWRWFSSNLGVGSEQDVLLVEASPDDGATWYTVESVGPGGPQAKRGWFANSASLDALFAPSEQVRVRFFVHDVGTRSYVHAAVDDVMLYEERCPGACVGDWTRDGTVNSTDVSEFINTWFEDQAQGTFDADFDGNGISNSTDVSEFINAWFGPC